MRSALEEELSEPDQAYGRLSESSMVFIRVTKKGYQRANVDTELRVPHRCQPESHLIMNK